MTKRWRDWPLRVYLAAFGLILLTPAIALGAIGILYYSNIERARLADTATDLAADVGRQIDRELENLAVVLKTLATSPYLQIGDFAEFHERAQRAVAGTDTHILLVDETMQQLMNTRVPYGTPLPPTSDPESSQYVLDTGRENISDVFEGAVAGEHVFNVEVPVLVNGTVRYVLIGTRSATSLLTQFDRPEVDLGWTLVVSDRRDAIISRSRDPAASVGKPLVDHVAKASTGPAGVHRTVSIDGTEVLRAYRRSPFSGWMVAAYTPLSVLEAPLRQTWWIFLAASCGLILLMVLLATLVARRVALPIDALRSSARALGRGELVSEHVSLLREANEVSRELSQASTDLRRHEQRLQYLMRELAHRTKNMLTLAIAIARQSMSRSTNYREFQESFARRLIALGASLDLLVKSEWRGIDMAELVSVQLMPFAETGGGRLTVDGPPVRLNAAATQQIGMALHELATNATKYGALSVPEGRIDISWQRTGDGGLLIVWQERNGPAVNPPTEQGFGRTLIEKAVANTLGAKVDIDFAVDGLYWKIELLPVSIAPDR